MRPFPGELQKVTSKSHPYTLNDEQKAWMAETFPVTENRKIMEVMGVSWPTLHKMAHELGLRKSEEGLKAIRQRKCEEHKRINRHHKLLLMSGHKITRCTNLRQHPYTKRQIDLRRSALDRGYLLDEDIREGSPGRYAIYYNDETPRSARFEDTCKRHGLRVEKE
jgi:hypothetical protein